MTEIEAKRGSTASLKVSETFGGRTVRRRRSPTAPSCTRYACADAAAGSTRATAATASATRTVRPRRLTRAAASRRPRRARARRGRRRSPPTTSATIVSVELPPPPSERLRLDRRRRRVGALRARTSRRPSRRSRSARPERVGLRRARPRPRNWKNASSSVRTPLPVDGPGHLLDRPRSRRSRSAGRSRFQPGGGDERVDREAVRHGQHDLRRRRVLLLGRHGEAEELTGVRERDRRADVRVRARRDRCDERRDRNERNGGRQTMPAACVVGSCECSFSEDSGRDGSLRRASRERDRARRARGAGGRPPQRRERRGTGTRARGRRAARRAGAPRRAGARAPPWAATTTSTSAARIGIASRCTGPTRQLSPCQPSPARQWIVDSRSANAERGRGEERQRPDGEPQRPEPRRARRAGVPRARAARARHARRATARRPRRAPRRRPRW